MSVHNSSESEHWGTPQKVRDVLFAFADGDVFDPCPGDSVVGVSMCDSDSKLTDGLSVSWAQGHRTVYVNPPYGRKVKYWVQKCIVEANNGTEVVLLTASRTDTTWCHDIFNCADAVCFIRRRLRFIGAKNDAPFPSVVSYFGERLDGFKKHFSSLGYVVSL